MGEILLRSSRSWKSAALSLALLPLLAFDLSPVWAEPQIADITAAVFLADPDQILLENPNAGPRLVAEVRDLVLSDPATLPSILGLLPKVSKAQKAAIGVGLGKAATISARSNPDYAKEIEQAVAQTRDADLIEAYYAATTGEYSGLGAGRTGLGSVSDTGILESGSPGTNFGVPPIFVPGNIASTPTTAPLITVPVPAVAAVVPGPMTAVEVPNVPVPGVPVPGVPSVPVSGLTVPSVAVPSLTEPSVTVSSLTVPSLTVPSAEVASVTVPSVAVTAFAVLPRFAPPTPLSEFISPH